MPINKLEKRTNTQSFLLILRDIFFIKSTGIKKIDTKAKRKKTRCVGDARDETTFAALQLAPQKNIANNTKSLSAMAVV